MKTAQSDNIAVIAGNVETLKTASPNAFVLLSKHRTLCKHCHNISVHGTRTASMTQRAYSATQET